jgi:ABC-type nitrate/sulfonate/bicarbonate transport system substrate-binding protein
MRKELLLAQVMRINKNLWILIVILLVSCSEAKSKEKKIRLGVPPRTNFMHVFVAEAKGFFKNNELDVDVVLTENINELYSEKKLSVICTGLAESIMFTNEGHETKIIYRFSNSFTNDVIIALPNIKDMTFLRNKKISFYGVNSSSHIFVQQLLSKNGIQDGEYLGVNLPMDKVMEELKAGNIDAGHITGVSLSEISKHGFHVIGKSSDEADLLSDTLSVDTQFLKSHESELRKLIQALNEANQFSSQNQSEAISLIAQKINKTTSQVEEELGGLEFLPLSKIQRTLKEPVVDISNLNQNKEISTENGLKAPEHGARNPGLILSNETMNFNSGDKKSGLFTAGETIIGFLKDRGQIYRNPILKSIIDDRLVKEFEAK